MPTYPTATQHPVEYHGMDTGDSCGPACAQMILASIGAGVLDQADLRDSAPALEDEKDDFITGPVQLKTMLNENAPSSFEPSYFALFTFEDPDTLAHRVAWTLTHYDVAPAVLINTGGHWIVARAYDADAEVTEDGSGSPEIDRFHIHYPETLRADPPPPPHASGDGCESTRRDWLTAAEWEATTPVASSSYANQRVAVCDPQPVRPPRRRILRRLPRRSGETLIPADEAERLALQDLTAIAASHPEWEAALTAVEHRRTYLVQRLDRMDSFYYLVRLTNSHDRRVVGVTVDAKHGLVLRGTIHEDTWSDTFGSALGVPALPDLRRATAGRLRRRLLRIRPEGVAAHPTLVWRSCRESLTPFLPFSLLNLPEHRIYVRADGVAFDELHFRKLGL